MVTDWLDAPLLQLYTEPLLAVNITLFPWQKVVGPPAVTVAAGTELNVRVTAVRWALSQDVLLFRLAP